MQYFNSSFMYMLAIYLIGYAALGAVSHVVFDIGPPLWTCLGSIAMGPWFLLLARDLRGRERNS